MAAQDTAPWWLRLPYDLNPANWSRGGQKVLGNGSNYNASTPAAQQGNPDIAQHTSEPTQADADAARQKQWDDFFNELNAPWDPNTPENQLLLKDVRAGTMQAANNQGIYGGYSNNMAEQAMFKAQAPLALQKKAMAMGALQGGTNFATNTRDHNYDVEKDKYTNAMDLWKFDQDKNQGIGSMIGGGLAGLAGGIGGFLLGGPGVAVKGAELGWGLGSAAGGSIGGNVGGGPPAFRPKGY